MQRYAMVRGGRIIAVSLRDPGEVRKAKLPPGTTLMLESDALAAGLTRDDPGSDPVGSPGQQAVQLNLAAASRSAAIADAATALATGTLAAKDVPAAVQQLAGWIATLARDDLVANRQRAALILRALDDFDPIGVAPQKAVITVTPAEATASGGVLS